MAKETKHLNEEKRPTRIPIHGARNIMAIPEMVKKPGYHYTWQPDRHSNLERFLNAGYAFVTDPGRANDLTANTSARLNGQGQALSMRSGEDTLYLLEVRQEWYDEDQAAIERLNKEREGKVNAPTEGGYVNKIEANVTTKPESETF